MARYCSSLLISLDLSFNCIAEISGLSSLVELEDLTLFSNQITSIKGLECCQKLNIFSIGNNKLKSFDTVTLSLSH